MKHAKPASRWMIGGVLLAALLAGAYWWRQSRPTAPALPDPTPVRVAPQPNPPVEPAMAQASPVPSGPLHPIDAAQTAATPVLPLPGLAESDPQIKEALIGWLGRRSVLSFLQIDGFVRRVVATVDNLARGHAASRLWPVTPTPARFLVLQRGDGTYLADGNAERYRPFVRFAASIDAAQAAAFYRQWYPLFQQAYEELGYPGKYFNDRLVEVIDQLLATPELAGPVKLTLTEVKGSVPVQHPWLRYEFADPALQALPAGQKILLRMGSANSQPLKAKLAEFRQHVTAPRP